MTLEEFKKSLDGLLVWISRTERPESSWWLSVEEYAKMEYARAYRNEQKVNVTE